MIKNYRFKITDEVVIVGNARDLIDLKGEKGNVVYLLPTTHLNDYEVELDSGKRIKVKEKEIVPIENKELLSIKIGQKVIHAPTNEEAEVYKIDYLYGHLGLKFQDGSTATVGIESVRKSENEGEKMEKKFKYNLGSKVITHTEDEEWDRKEGIVIDRKHLDSFNEYTVSFGDFDSNFGESELKLVCELGIPKTEINYFEEKGLEIGKLVNKKQAAYGDSIGKTSKLMKVFLEGYRNEDNTYTIPEELLDHILLQVRIIDKQNRIFSNPKGDLMQENPYADTVGYSLLGMRMAELK